MKRAPKPRSIVLDVPQWVEGLDDASLQTDVMLAIMHRADAVAHGANRRPVGRKLVRRADALLARVEQRPTAKGAMDLAGQAEYLYREAGDGKCKTRPLKFPVLKGKPVWPSKPTCPQCGKHKVMEPHSMAVLTGGALRVTDPHTKSAEIAKDCIGFLDLKWHGAHGSGTGVGRDVYVSVPLADETPNGQFEMYFCSTRCLREFLNACVDELESKSIARGRRSSKRRGKRP